MINVAGVRFKNTGKVYYFDPGELDIKTGEGVIVETARGMLSRLFSRVHARGGA